MGYTSLRNFLSDFFFQLYTIESTTLLFIHATNLFNRRKITYVKNLFTEGEKIV